MDLVAYIWNVTDVLSLLTIVGQGTAACLLILLVLGRLRHRTLTITRWVSRYGLALMLIVSLTAMCGSLYFSEVVGWTPCKDCWPQRICMYPQVVLLAIALWKGDRKVARYVLALSLIGILISSYHYFVQMQNIVAAPTNPATPCGATGVSCVKTPFVEYGYITIPLMAWTAFALNIVASLSMVLAGY